MVMRIVTIKMDEDLLEQVDLYAQKVNMTRSEFVRKAIIEYLEKLMLAEKPKSSRLVIIG